MCVCERERERERERDEADITWQLRNVVVLGRVSLRKISIYLVIARTLPLLNETRTLSALESNTSGCISQKTGDQSCGKNTDDFPFGEFVCGEVAGAALGAVFRLLGC